MNQSFIYPSAVVVFISTTVKSFAQQNPADIATQLDKERITLFNGWSLTPVGKSLLLEGMLLNIAVSPSGKYLAVTNNGDGNQTITLIDAMNDKIVDN